MDKQKINQLPNNNKKVLSWGKFNIIFWIFFLISLISSVYVFELFKISRSNDDPRFFAPMFIWRIGVILILLSIYYFSKVYEYHRQAQSIFLRLILFLVLLSFISSGLRFLNDIHSDIIIKWAFNFFHFAWIVVILAGYKHLYSLIKNKS